MPDIKFSGVHHYYGDRHVLRGISLTLSEQRIGIIGANGSGKTTLARMINGLVTPTQGQVTVAGLKVAKHGREVRRKVGFIFSDAENQIIMPTVAEDVAFSLRRSSLSKTERKNKVIETLRSFDLEDYADHPPHLLSGGQKQLLALASITIGTPEIIIADEPTTLLDLRNSRAIAELFRQLPQQLIVVTHDLNLVADFERVIVIDEGHILEDSSPEQAISAYIRHMEQQ